MTVKAYQDIYAKFEELCPAIVKSVDYWVGLSFREHCIGMRMKDGSDLIFIYVGDSDWFLMRAGIEETNNEKLAKYVSHFFDTTAPEWLQKKLDTRPPRKPKVTKRSRTKTEKKLVDFLE